MERIRSRWTIFQFHYWCKYLKKSRPSICLSSLTENLALDSLQNLKDISYIWIPNFQDGDVSWEFFQQISRYLPSPWFDLFLMLPRILPCQDQSLPDDSREYLQHLLRLKPLGISPQNFLFVGQQKRPSHGLFQKKRYLCEYPMLIPNSRLLARNLFIFGPLW